MDDWAAAIALQVAASVPRKSTRKLSHDQFKLLRTRKGKGYVAPMGPRPQMQGQPSTIDEETGMAIPPGYHPMTKEEALITVAEWRSTWS